MYWTDWTTDKIQRSNLDGSGVEDLVTRNDGFSSPRGIALDAAGGKMYWTVQVLHKIQRSNLDGSGVEDLVTTGLGTPWSIALDLSGGKMYWTDPPEEKIQRSNLDGSGVEDLVTTGLSSPSGIALGFGVPVLAGKDLVVRVSVSDNTLTPMQSFTLSVTVRSQGTEQAAATTLRYYRSDDATISTNDTEVGTDAVSGLATLATSDHSIDLTAPSDAGTYYYGACVDGVSGESNTGNNCSSAVTVTVGDGGGDSGDEISISNVTCSGRYLFGNSGSATISIGGTVYANRSVHSLRLTGFANGKFVGSHFIGILGAGKSERFSISGIISTSGTSLDCSVSSEYSFFTTGSSKVTAGDAESSGQARAQGSLSASSAPLNRNRTLEKPQEVE